MRSWSGASGRWGTIRRYLFERAGDPVYPGPTTQHLVGQGPRALPGVWGKNPPVTASPCQPLLGKGAEGTGVTDCHSQCAHWLRNDREFYMECGTAGRCGQRPLRMGLQGVQWAGGRKGRPYGRIINSAVGRDDVGIVPYEMAWGCMGGGADVSCGIILVLVT